MTLKPFAALLTLVLLATFGLPLHPANAQTSPTPVLSPAQAEQERQALEAKAAALLTELIAEINSLRLPENRIYVQAKAAGLLWPRDEARARELLKQAQAQLAELLAQMTPADPQYYELLNTANNLRSAIFEVWAAHDAKLALEFLRSTRFTQNPQHRRTDYHPEREMELQLAVRIAAFDPQLALETAEETLKKGLSYQLAPLFQTLQSKDPKAAVKLLDAITSQIKTADFSRDYNALHLVSGLIRQLQPQLQATPPPPNGPNGPVVQMGATAAAKRITTEEAQKGVRDLLETLIAVALKLTAGSFLNEQEAGTARSLLTHLHQFQPLIEQQLPQRLPAVRARLGQFEKSFRQQGNLHETYQVANRSAEELVALAAKAPAEARHYLYSEAANKALAKGDQEQARQLINEHVSDPQQRQQILNNLDRQVIYQAGNAGKYEEARALFARLSSEAERAAYLTQWAIQAADKGDRKLAQQLLEEARQLLGNGFDTRTRLEAQLQIAQAYAQFAHERSFELMETAVTRLNPLLAAYAVINSYEQNGQFAEGEGRIANGAAQNLAYSFAGPLPLLARRDFERTKELLKRWEANEVRVYYYLTLVQELLNNQTGQFHNRNLPIQGRHLPRLH